MMRYSMILTAAVMMVLGFTACKKSDNKNSAKTVANVSGSYKLTALTASQGGSNFNMYDSLPACEKDNLIVLNTNGSAQFVDAGVACDPPQDSTGAWHLSPNADSIYLGNDAAYINSFDGKTLKLTTDQKISGFTVTATTTLTKQ